MPVLSQPRTRDYRLDLFRGLALIFIFINHVPGNTLSWLTNRNYGLSDATEIFVFVSGMAVALAYGRIAARHGIVAALPRILARAWQVYATHIFLVVAMLAAVATVTASWDRTTFAEEMHVRSFFMDTEDALLNALLMTYRPTNTDVLPLYVVLMLGLPALLWGMVRMPRLTLLVSAVLWQSATQFGWNLPTWPGGVWVFNPLAWQFLFTLGIFCVVYRPLQGWTARHARWLTWLSIAYLGAFAPLAIGWSWPAMAFTLPGWLESLLLPVDKVDADILRILHFLAQAWLAVRLLPRGHALLATPLARVAIACGQHSLPVFSAGILLSFAAYVAMVEIGSSLAAQVAVTTIGIALLAAVAWLAAFLGRPVEPGSYRRHPARARNRAHLVRADLSQGRRLT